MGLHARGDGHIRQSLLEKSANLPAAIGAAIVASAGLASVTVFTAWADNLARKKQAKVEIKTFQALPPVIVSRLSERRLMPSTAAVSVRDEDILHAYRDGKPASILWDWYRELPKNFPGYKAVLLDKTEAKPALLFIYDIAGKTGKLVVKLDFAAVVRGQDGIKRKASYNMLRTGKIITDTTGLGNKAAYELLDGKL